MSNNNMEAILYLSSKQPSVNKVFNYKDTSINYNSLLDGYVIYLSETKTNIQYEATINMLREGSSYIKSIWDKSDRNIAWERTILNKELPPIENDEQGEPIKNTLTIYYPSITIKYFHPSHLYTPNPYWLKTQVEVKNPISITPNPLFPSPIFIVQVKRSDYDEETQYFFKDLLPDILEELDEINVNNLDRLDELRKLKNVLDKILRNWHNIYNNIPDISTDSPLQQLLSNLEKIAEEFTDKKLTNTIKIIKDLVKLITDKAQRKDFYWLKKVSDKEQEHIETYPVVCPGEYIQLKWHLDVGNNNPIDDFDSDEIINKNEIIDMVKFETPLFTGGKIVEKFGTGVDTRYTVEIFGKEYYNIVPTDFFDYEVGKWCYLMKVNTQLSGEHQSYGSSNLIDSETKNNVNLLFEKINQLRIDENIPPLIFNSYLITAAHKHAEDMSLKRYLSHINTNQEGYTDRIIKAGYLNEINEYVEYEINENIFKCDASYSLDKVIELWLKAFVVKNNVLNEDFIETGIGISDIRDNNIYYCQVFGYRNDGINVGMESSYRITPFNFGGIIHQSNEMAISYQNELFIDFETNFEKIFDMKNYRGTIKEINYDNDTAIIDVLLNPNYIVTQEEPQFLELDLPIFYHCTGEPSVEHGSFAFKESNDIILYANSDFTNTHIIAHDKTLVPCGVLIEITINDCSDSLPLAEVLIQLKINTINGEVIKQSFTNMSGLAIFSFLDVDRPIDETLNMSASKAKYDSLDVDISLSNDIGFLEATYCLTPTEEEEEEEDEYILDPYKTYYFTYEVWDKGGKYTDLSDVENFTTNSTDIPPNTPYTQQRRKFTQRYEVYVGYFPNDKQQTGLLGWYAWDYITITTKYQNLNNPYDVFPPRDKNGNFYETNPEQTYETEGTLKIGHLIDKTIYINTNYTFNYGYSIAQRFGFNLEYAKFELDQYRHIYRIKNGFRKVITDTTIETEKNIETNFFEVKKE